MKKIPLLLASTFLLSCLFSSISYAEKLPNLPIAIKNGAGALNQDTIYIGLGSAGQAWYKLDLNQTQKHWQQVADFPGTVRDQAVAITLGKDIYVFGGLGLDSENSTTPSVLTEVYRYSPTDNMWQKVDTRAPHGLVGHAVTTNGNDQAIIFGGVNKQIFDGYFADLARTNNDKMAQDKVIQDYFNKPAKDYFFNQSIMGYDSTKNQWYSLGVTPFAGTAGSVIAKDHNSYLLINGEIKPGLRTDTIQPGVLADGVMDWMPTLTLPPAQDMSIQEGLAGAFAGYSNDILLIAGGANFPGAKANYAQQHYFAHDGLTKTWQQTIYSINLENENQWQIAGQLPIPLAYGISVEYDDSIYLIGGETTGSQASDAVFTLTMQGNKLVIE